MRNLLEKKSFEPVTGVTSKPGHPEEHSRRRRRNRMVSTRLAPPCTALGLDATDRRNRVDPVKLLDLIQRLKTASGAQKPALAETQPKTSAKAG
jgi:hypothetical protein